MVEYLRSDLRNSYAFDLNQDSFEYCFSLFVSVLEAELLLSCSSNSCFISSFKAHARTSLNSLEKELCCLRMERDETLKRINDKRY